MCKANLRSRYLINLSLSLMLVCANTYGSDDLLDGPGVFTGKNGEFSLSQLLAAKSKPSPQANSNGQQATPDLADSEAKDEFELFKLWHQSKTEFTADYQQFLLWVKYQHYLEQKKD